jgi:hypothetical protein
MKIETPDARGWIGAGCFVLVLIVLGMIAIDKSLLDNNAFLVLATAIVITGWANGPVGWAYQATKSGGEMAESSARIAEQAATAAVGGVVPKTATDAADKVADAAQNAADGIKGE